MLADAPEWGWTLTWAAPKSRRARPVSILFGLSLVLSTLIQADLWGRPLAFFFERWHAMTFSLFALFAAQALAARSTERAEGGEAAIGEAAKGMSQAALNAVPAKH